MREQITLRVVIAIYIFLISSFAHSAHFNVPECDALHELTTLIASKIQGISKAEQAAIQSCADEYYLGQYKKRNFKCKSKKDFLTFANDLAKRAKIPPNFSVFNVQMVGTSCLLKVTTID